jgi:Lon protease-like protein
LNYYGAPAVHRVGTLGTIEQAVTLDDGRYNILVRGDARFRIVEEIRESPYRVARVIVDPEADCEPDEAVVQRKWLVDLSQRYLEFLPDQGQIPELETASLDAITNALVMSLNLDTEEKQQLLEIDRLSTRSGRVAAELERRIASMEFLAPFRRSGDPSAN